MRNADRPAPLVPVAFIVFVLTVGVWLASLIFSP